MDVCKYIVPSRHRGAFNSRRAANPLVRLVEGEESSNLFEAHLKVFLFRNQKFIVLLIMDLNRAAPFCKRCSRRL
ncbi:hypothetical protein TNCV_4528681 [Trichonephila clavipes]|nr:hypothetical protein TNCV_4528681 [Trichonephila clavipes]